MIWLVRTKKLKTLDFSKKNSEITFKITHYVNLFKFDSIILTTVYIALLIVAEELF